MHKDITPIPLSVPNLKGNELKYITEAIETEWISTSGPFIDSFEQLISEYVHIEGAISCQNGTSGLHIALLLTGVTANDEVIVPTLTFIAAVNPVKYIGAEPVFMDCDDSLCMDPVKLRQFCENECELTDGHLIDKSSHRQVKTILVVHVFGNMADMEAIMEIAEMYNIKVVEDATEALGTCYIEGKFKGKFAGTVGDVGVYSFNGNKIITTGGGGMIVSDRPEYLARAKHLTTQAKQNELYYIHDEIGYNYRMTNLQAALGIAQLEQLEEFIEIKNRNYDLYKKYFASFSDLRLLECKKNIRCNRWFYALYCDGEYYRRDALIKHMANNNIQSRPIWGLINEQKPYEESRTYKIVKARKFRDSVVNLPCSTNLNCKDIKRIVKCIGEY